MVSFFSGGKLVLIEIQIENLCSHKIFALGLAFKMKLRQFEYSKRQITTQRLKWEYLRLISYSSDNTRFRAVSTLCDWLKILAPFSWPIRSKTSLAHTGFPALDAGYMYLLRVLIGWLCCLRLLWLVRTLITHLKTTLRDSLRSFLFGIKLRLHQETSHFTFSVSCWWIR